MVKQVMHLDITKLIMSKSSMSLKAETKDALLKNLFYSPNAQFTSVKALYEQVENKGIKKRK